MINLNEFLKSHHTNNELSSIVADLAEVGKKLTHELQRSGLLDLHGAAGGQNVHDEEVQKLDEHSNEIVKEILGANRNIIGLASEEEPNEVDVSSGAKEGYIVAFDPLDGSSNIDINMPVGTIFSVMPSAGNIKEDFLQTADNQVLAGYILYSSSTNLVFSTGAGVHEFTLDPDKNEFVLTNENIKIPENSGYVSYNSAHLLTMDKKQAESYRDLLERTGFSVRYAGAMVGDVHRTLLKGGFFGYPAVARNDKLKAKLRMQYEAKPLGWLIEQAGGRALVNGQSINQHKSTEIHEKVAIEMGDAGTMALFEKLLD